MADDYTQPIEVDIISSVVQLDDKTQLSNERFVLGWMVIVYEIDEDATLDLYYRRNRDMEFTAMNSITLSKDHKRFYRRLPLNIGSVIDFYIKVSGNFKEFQITSFKIFTKIIPTGKHNG
jgi:hypothetical protein